MHALLLTVWKESVRNTDVTLILFIYHYYKSNSDVVNKM